MILNNSYMSTSKTVNIGINKLPIINEIVSGDFLIIDNGSETRRLDFSDFIVGLENVTFASTISANSVNISTLSANVTPDNLKAVTQYYMVGNVTVTPVGSAGVFYKILGNTISGDIVQNFSNSNNRATLTNTRTNFYKIHSCLSFTSGNNNVIEVRIAKNGVTRPSSANRVTCSGTGTAESVDVIDIVSLAPGDFIEMYISNITATNNITVTNLNVTVIPIF
jgi:hypothetical protein